MISPFHSIVNHDGNDWEDFLEKCLLIDIFLPVLKNYTNVEDAKCAIKYIAYAYSFQSDKVILGMDWQKNKQSIFEFVMVRPVKGMYEDLVLLKNESVVSSIQKWIQFQDNDTYIQLTMLRDLKMEMQLSCQAPISIVDFDQKYKNAGYAMDLKQKIKDLEAELIQNDMKMKDGVKELKQTKSRYTVGPETFSK